MELIINKVAQSALVLIDLAEIYPKPIKSEFDLKHHLFQGLILKEKDFRKALTQHDWSKYKDSFVALHCSVSVVVPEWAYLLITTYLPESATVYFCKPSELDNHIAQKWISDFDLAPYKDKPTIIKGCSRDDIPTQAYVLLIEKLRPHVRSIMYGEACSTVPLYKKKTNEKKS